MTSEGRSKEQEGKVNKGIVQFKCKPKQVL